MTINKNVQIIQPTIGLEAEKLIRVAAYCRVSTDSEDQADSFLAQVKYYNDFFKSQSNMILVDIYADEGITGTCMNKREEFKRLIKDCTLGRIDRVYVKSVSRFARNSLECLETIRKLKECGVSVVFENDNVDTKTMNSELILYVKSAFAQSEALAGSRRVSTAYRMKMENGTFFTYCAPFGYRLVDQRLVIEPSEAEIVKRIFNMYLSGSGINTIAATMNREVVAGKTHWSTTMVKYLLTNEKYIGDSMMQKTYTPQVFPLRNIPNKGELDKYYAENTHEPIIHKEDFDAVQRLLQQRGDLVKTQSTKRLLTKMLVCDECGWSYKFKRQNNVDYWVCSRKGNAGYECSGPNISEQSVFDAFVRVYNKLRYFEKEVLDATLSMMSDLRMKLITENDEIRQIDIEVAKLCEQNNRYEKYREKKIMDDVSFMEQTDRLKARLTELRSRRLKLLSENENEQLIDQLKTLKETIQDYPKAIVEFDPVLFTSIVNRIKVRHDGTLVFELKGELALKERIEVSRKCA